MVYNSPTFKYSYFVDRAVKLTFAENMKEALAVEKCIIALEKKVALEDRKSKKVSFKDDSKKKTCRNFE